MFARPSMATFMALVLACSTTGLYAQQAAVEPAALVASTDTVKAASSADAAPAASPAEPAQAAPVADVATAAPAAAPTEATQAAPAEPAASDEAAPGADAKAVPAAVGGKKKKVKKEKPPKQIPMSIVQGTLTVDGWTGKARLNYDIADLKYVYIWAPGIGTVVVSENKFPLATEQPNGFSENSLTLTADGHSIQLTSDKRLLGKKPQSAWVYVDTGYKYASMYPAMGYGNTTQAPYAWPGAKQVAVKAGVVPPPPLPVGLKAATVSQGCVGTAAKPCAAINPSMTAAAAQTTPAQ